MIMVTPVCPTLGIFLICLNLVFLAVSGGVSHSKQKGGKVDRQPPARSEPVVHKFRSALGSEYLTALVLQYAMYDREARKKLTAGPILWSGALAAPCPRCFDRLKKFNPEVDYYSLLIPYLPDVAARTKCKCVSGYAPSLAHFFEQPHKRNFVVEELGVEVIGAGCTQMNGWYRRRESHEGPPESYRCFSGATNEQGWRTEIDGRPWFEKDDGCYIHYDSYGTSKQTYWFCHNEDGGSEYKVKASWEIDSSDSDSGDWSHIPPAAGWRTFSMHSHYPTPTLRVVS